MQRYYIEPEKQEPETTLQAGTDEVARGCLFGRIYGAAVILDPAKDLPPWLNDSKKTTKKRRAVLREWIEENALCWSVAYRTAKDIQERGINTCNYEVMKEAIDNLSVKPEFLIVDFVKFNTDGFGIPHIKIEKGDSKYAPIAAASIIAKEHHDDYIKALVEEEPLLHERYNLGSNVGYHSPLHRQGLVTFGPHEEHRLSFLSRIITKPRLLFPDEEEDDPREATGSTFTVTAE